MYNENYDSYAEASAANDSNYAQHLENTQERYEYQAKAEAQTFYAELFDIAARYSLSTLGDMERAGIGSVGETLMQAIAKLELLKQSL